MSDHQGGGKMTTASDMEADFQELQKLRSNTADRNNAILDARNAEADKDHAHGRKEAIKTGLLTTGDTVKEGAAKAELESVRAIASKKTQDANGTWAMTKSALASSRPDKPFVAAARTTEAAAVSRTSSESQSISRGQGS